MNARLLGLGTLLGAFGAIVFLQACGDVRISLGRDDDGPDVVSETGPPDTTPPPNDGGDAEADAPVVRRTCTAGSAFESVALVRGFETTDIWSARLSDDETTVFVSVPKTPGTAVGFDLYSAGRPTPGGAFGPLTKLSISTTNDDYWPTLDLTGKIMFFESGARPDGGDGTSRVWFASRVTVPGNFTASIWDYFANVPEEVTEGAPYLLPNARKLYWASVGRDGALTLDLWEADVTTAGTVATASRLAISTDDENECFPAAAEDDTELFFGRRGAVLPDDIFVSVRGPGGTFATATALPAPVNTAADNEWSSWVSPDACRLYFVRKREGLEEARLWVATRSPR